MRHRSLAMVMAVLALFAATSVALAGGWAQVSAKTVPTDPPAGEPTTIELKMLQHGVTPVSWPRLTVTATDKASGTVLTETATASGPEGTYTVTFTFPSAGNWTLAFESKDLIMEGGVSLKVGAPAGAPAAPSTATATTAEMTAAQVIGMALAGLAIAIGAALVVGGLLLRRRESGAGAGVAAHV